jgi:hypothetical protein
MAAATSTENASAIPEITLTMLEDPTAFLFVLNNTLQFLASLSAYLQGGTGPVTIKNSMTAPGFFAESDAVPNDPNELLTLGAAVTLFGSSKQIANSSLSTNPVPPLQPTPGTAAIVKTQEITAVHGTTTPIPATFAPAVDSLLSVVVAQDATGGGQITWDPLFVNAPVNIGRLPNKINLFLFLGRLDPVDSIVKWFMVALPLVGQSQ